MAIPVADRDVLRELAERTAAVAALPVHKQTAAEWRRLNGLKRGRPLVWINEIPWHEMNVDDELTLRCADPLARQTEWNFRAQLYQWEHMPADMVVEPRYYSPLVIRDSGFGIEEEGELIPQHEGGGIYSHGFRPQITCEADVELIKMPAVTHDAEASAANAQALSNAFGDILPVFPCGIVTYWFAPWDELIRWWGVTEAMTDLIERPSLVHLAMERLTQAYLSRLDQWEALGVLSQTAGNYRVGSGGLAYAGELPQPDRPQTPARPSDQWGNATAQILGSVSPEMHEEFALRYERRWLARFGLTYYGCCEPLHDKLAILATIPNLRKASMSPWADLARSAALVGGRYVLSHKPNPAIFVTDAYNPTAARIALTTAIDQAGGHPLEIIMKDISTVRDDPKRLWDWAAMAMDLMCELG